MGVVWLARDGLLDRDVAVKEMLLPADGADTGDAVDQLASRVMREAQAAARLRHPGIITVHDVIVDDGRPWIIMELVGGRSLAQVIAEAGALGEQQAAMIGVRVLDALQAAHRRGILHRDVKPSNILLDGDRVVLTDFGIAAVDGATALTATGQMVGSPEYLPPERVSGRPATAAGDLWALGVTLFQTVTGHSPFRREDVPSTFAAVLHGRVARPAGTDRLWPVLKGLLAKDPARRLTADRAAELLAKAGQPAAASQAAAPSSPALTSPSAGGTVARIWSTRTVRWAGIPVAIAVIIAAALIWVMPDGRDRGPRGGTAAAPSPSTVTSSSPAVPPVRNLPPPPPGFTTVTSFKTFVFALPQPWVEENLVWANQDDSRAGSLLRARPSVETPSGTDTRISAAAYLTLAHERMPKGSYHRIRLTGVAVPPGASSAAEWEYTSVLPQYVAKHGERRFSHTLTRALALPTGKIIMLSVSVTSESAEALDRDWQQHRPTLTQITGSLRQLV